MNSFDTSLSPKNIFLRDRVLAILEQYTCFSDATVLEVGVGCGRWASLLAPLCQEYDGVDTNPERLAMAREIGLDNLSLYLGTGEALPVQGPYNVVLYMNSWHKMGFDSTLAESVRVLSPDGIILIEEPTDRSSFLDPKLVSGNPEYDTKMQDLRRGAGYLETQTQVDLVENGPFDTTKQYWVLKRKH